MKIFSVSQIKAWDQFTIQHEPVSSLNLMERAATACCNWIMHHYQGEQSFIVFCGKGNNGGDGLAIARHLIEKKYAVSVFILGEKSLSPDFEKNLKRLRTLSNEIFFLENENEFPSLKNEIVIDALFGTGLNKNPSGLYFSLIKHINRNASAVISIDIPSGLFADKSSKYNKAIKSNFTLTFQNQKLAFLMAENAPFVGRVVSLDIRLSKEFHEKENSVYELIDKELIKKIYNPRNPFSHKGTYGYACLLSGSFGMMGASVLSAGACLRSGVGKLTCVVPGVGYSIMQSSVPEAMCNISGNHFLKKATNLENYDVVGVGPGIGKKDSHKKLLKKLFKKFRKPIVIDADALNVISQNRKLRKFIPPQSILTPHPKEFERLFGKTNSDFNLIETALAKSKSLNVYIVVKGHHTFIATPEGKGYFNSTGNAGMATAGSGDVLTGIITSLLAQKYSPMHACILGVYIHGMSGDIAANKISKEAMIAGDIVNYLGDAFKRLI
ncbi:MAG: NAD(P)H-hydrate dehydratase [Ginsengibacter sp.]